VDKIFATWYLVYPFLQKQGSGNQKTGDRHLSQDYLFFLSRAGKIGNKFVFAIPN
jgi:hypothetical protein